MSVTAEEVKGMLDVALLPPTTTPTEVEAVALIVRNEGYGQMCVNTAHIQRAAAALKGSRVKVVAPVGFPLGAVKTEIKVFEAEHALADGAAEIDMVLNIGVFLDGDFKSAEGDVRAVVKAAGGAVVKVIIETPFLTDRQKADASRVAQAAGGKFTVFDFHFNWSQPYLFWTGLVGGTFLNTASHGTDQLIVQQLLAARYITRFLGADAPALGDEDRKRRFAPVIDGVGYRAHQNKE